MTCEGCPAIDVCLEANIHINSHRCVHFQYNLAMYVQDSVALAQKNSKNKYRSHDYFDMLKPVIFGDEK